MGIILFCQLEREGSYCGINREAPESTAFTYSYFLIMACGIRPGLPYSPRFSLNTIQFAENYKED
jgi:hypothetical protein